MASVRVTLLCSHAAARGKHTADRCAQSSNVILHDGSGPQTACVRSHRHGVGWIGNLLLDHGSSSTSTIWRSRSSSASSNIHLQHNAELPIATPHPSNASRAECDEWEAVLLAADVTRLSAAAQDKQDRDQAAAPEPGSSWMKQPAYAAGRVRLTFHTPAGERRNKGLGECAHPRQGPTRGGPVGHGDSSVGSGHWSIEVEPWSGTSVSNTVSNDLSDVNQKRSHCGCSGRIAADKRLAKVNAACWHCWRCRYCRPGTLTWGQDGSSRSCTLSSSQPVGTLPLQAGAGAPGPSSSHAEQAALGSAAAAATLAALQEFCSVLCGYQLLGLAAVATAAVREMPAGDADALLQAAQDILGCSIQVLSGEVWPGGAVSAGRGWRGPGGVLISSQGPDVLFATPHPLQACATGGHECWSWGSVLGCDTRQQP